MLALYFLRKPPFVYEKQPLQIVNLGQNFRLLSFNDVLKMGSLIKKLRFHKVVKGNQS